MRSEPGAAKVQAGGLRAEIFSIKNFRKLSQRVGDGNTGELSQGFTRELKMLKRTCGLRLLMETRLEKYSILAALTELW